MRQWSRERIRRAPRSVWRRRSGTRPQISLRPATGATAATGAAAGAVVNVNRADDEAALSPVSLPTRTSTVPSTPAGATAVMWLLPSMVKEPATSPKMTVVAWPSRAPSMPTAVPGRPLPGVTAVTSGAAGAAVVEPVALLSVMSRSPAWADAVTVWAIAVPPSVSRSTASTSVNCAELPLSMKARDAVTVPAAPGAGVERTNAAPLV